MATEIGERVADKTTPVRLNTRFVDELRKLCGALGSTVADELERRMLPMLDQMRREAIERLQGRDRS